MTFLLLAYTFFSHPAYSLSVENAESNKNTVMYATKHSPSHGMKDKFSI